MTSTVKQILVFVDVKGAHCGSALEAAQSNVRHASYAIFNYISYIQSGDYTFDLDDFMKAVACLNNAVADVYLFSKGNPDDNPERDNNLLHRGE